MSSGKYFSMEFAQNVANVFINNLQQLRPAAYFTNPRKGVIGGVCKSNQKCLISF